MPPKIRDINKRNRKVRKAFSPKILGSFLKKIPILLNFILGIFIYLSEAKGGDEGKLHLLVKTFIDKEVLVSPEKKSFDLSSFSVNFRVFKLRISIK